MEGSGQPQGGGRPPGWYPNPEGPGQRLWDGEKWTDSYSQAPPQQPVPPQPTSNTGRNCLIAALVILALAAVAVVGCVAFVGVGVEEGLEEGVDQLEKQQDRRAITPAEFRSIEEGMTESEMRARLGPPQSTDTFGNEVPKRRRGRGQPKCIYYPEKGKPLFEGDRFQFCFEKGKLTSKKAN